MFEPSLSFLRDTVDPAIKQIRSAPIKRSSVPAIVYRIWLESIDGQCPRSVVVKVVEPGWPGDPEGHNRETNFYRLLLPKLRLPHPQVYYAGPEPGTLSNLVVLEDVEHCHRFPSPQHIWTQREITQILNSYAWLHASGQMILPAEEKHDWLIERHEKRLFETADELPAMFETLASQGIWPQMNGLGSLLEWTLRAAEQFSDWPATVLHNDVYPPNCGIPVDPEKEVVLIDWDMVSTGLAEMDLAFMFMQPYNSHRQVDRKEALAYYWRCRQKLDGEHPSTTELRARQRYADALWALWLIPVAYRMWSSPFPPNSGPQLYWDSMYGVLGERLLTLANEL